MPTIGELKHKLRQPHIIIYGAAGTWKTCLATTLGEGSQIIDLDDGLLSAITMPDEFLPQRHKVSAKQFLEESSEKATVYDKVSSFLLQVGKAIRAKTYPHKALIIDSWTALTESCIRTVLRANNHLGCAPTQPEWGVILTKLTNTLVELRSMPIVVILICHKQFHEVEGVESADLLTPGKKMPGQIASYFDEVWLMKQQLKSGEMDFIIQSRGTAQAVARTRAGMADKQSARVGMPKLLELMGYKWGGDEEGAEGAVKEGEQSEAS